MSDDLMKELRILSEETEFLVVVMVVYGAVCGTLGVLVTLIVLGGCR